MDTQTGCRDNVRKSCLNGLYKLRNTDTYGRSF